MQKQLRRMLFCGVLAMAFLVGGFAANIRPIHTELPEAAAREGLPANWPSREKILLTLQSAIARDMAQITDPNAAWQYLERKLPRLQELVLASLKSLGLDVPAALQVIAPAEGETEANSQGPYLEISLGDSQRWRFSLPGLVPSREDLAVEGE